MIRLSPMNRRFSTQTVFGFRAAVACLALLAGALHGHGGEPEAWWISVEMLEAPPALVHRLTRPRDPREPVKARLPLLQEALKKGQAKRLMAAAGVAGKDVENESDEEESAFPLRFSLTLSRTEVRIVEYLPGKKVALPQTAECDYHFPLEIEISKAEDGATYLTLLVEDGSLPLPDSSVLETPAGPLALGGEDTVCADSRSRLDSAWLIEPGPIFDRTPSFFLIHARKIKSEDADDREADAFRKRLRAKGVSLQLLRASATVLQQIKQASSLYPMLKEEDLERIVQQSVFLARADLPEVPSNFYGDPRFEHAYVGSYGGTGDVVVPVVESFMSGLEGECELGDEIPGYAVVKTIFRELRQPFDRIQTAAGPLGLPRSDGLRLATMIPFEFSTSPLVLCEVDGTCRFFGDDESFFPPENHDAATGANGDAAKPEDYRLLWILMPPVGLIEPPAGDKEPNGEEPADNDNAFGEDW